MNILKNDKIKELWSNPLLRYSNILNGLFHEKVVVCESDYDCMFYQAILDAFCANKGEIAPDILFTYCGGKDRIHTVINALSTVKVTAIAVYDIDILNDATNLQKAINEYTIKWDDIASSFNVLSNFVRGRRPQLVPADVKKELLGLANSLQDSEGTISKEFINNVENIMKQASAWAEIKRTGKEYFQADAYKAFSSMDSIFRKKGLFVVPVGEIESFYKPAGGHGSKWWDNLVQDKVDFATCSELSAARDFIKAIADFNPRIIEDSEKCVEPTEEGTS